MLPMRFFRNRTFTAANLASLFMFFGMFGSIFLLAQYFQTVQGSSPLEAGLRILPWTAMPILIAPIAGLLSDRIGGRPIMAAGLALQATGLAWIGAILTTTLPYSSIVIPFTLSGIGMAMYFAPVANVVLSSVKPDEEGQASGANNAIRELGGVFGVAVLAAVFSHYGGYQTPASFVHGVTPALYLGAALVAIGAASSVAHPAASPALGRGTADRAQRPHDPPGLPRGRCCRDQRDRCVGHGVGHHHTEHAPRGGRARARHPCADRCVPGRHPLARARRPLSTRARHERSKAPLARHPALVPEGAREREAGAVHAAQGRGIHRR